MDLTIGIVLLVALVGVVGLMAVARRAGAVPNQRRIDQADGTMPAFIDAGSSGSDCGGADGGGSCN